MELSTSYAKVRVTKLYKYAVMLSSYEMSDIYETRIDKKERKIEKNLHHNASPSSNNLAWGHDNGWNAVFSSIANSS